MLGGKKDNTSTGLRDVAQHGDVAAVHVLRIPWSSLCNSSLVVEVSWNFLSNFSDSSNVGGVPRQQVFCELTRREEGPRSAWGTQILEKARRSVSSAVRGRS